MGDLSLSEPPVVHREDTWCPGHQNVLQCGHRSAQAGIWGVMARF